MRTQKQNRRIKQVKSTQPKQQVIPVQKRGISNRTKRVAIIWLAIILILLVLTPVEFVQPVALIGLGSLALTA